MIEIKKILEDKVKFSYLVSAIALGAFAFLLLIKHDVGNLFKFERALKETHDSLKFLENTADYKDYISHFDSQYAESKGANWLMDILTNFSRDEGIALGVIKPLETRTVSGYKIVRVTTDGTAPYSSLLRLVEMLESYKKYIVIIEQLTVDVQERSSVRVAKFTISIASISAGI